MTTNVKVIPPHSVAARQARPLLVFATLFWGASFPLLRGLELAQEALAPHVSDALLACVDVTIRFGAAALILLPFFGRSLLTATSREFSQGLGLGILAGMGLYLQNLGLAWTDASISAFLTQLGVLVIPLIVAVRDRRWPGLRVFGACLMVLVGVSILSPGFLKHFVLGPGEVITLISACFFAAQIVWVERCIYATNRSGVVTIIMMAVMFSISLVAYPLMGGTWAATKLLFGSPAIAILMTAIVIFCTICSFFIMNTWQRYISAVEAGLIYCLEPVIATLLAGFLPGWISTLAGIHYGNEKLRWGLLAGGALIIGAALLAREQPVSVGRDARAELA